MHAIPRGSHDGPLPAPDWDAAWSHSGRGSLGLAAEVDDHAAVQSGKDCKQSTAYGTVLGEEDEESSGDTADDTIP